MSLEWPSALPKAEARGYTESPPDSRIFSEMDMGPPKVRRRFTAQIRPYEITIQMTKTELETFDAFFTVTTQGGSLPFDFPNPRGAGTIQARFGRTPPQYSSFNGGYCVVSFALEKLP